MDKVAKIWEILETVCDPEVPVLTIIDLGVVRNVAIQDDDVVEITLTPTYTGCPAMDLISVNIKAALQDKGFMKVDVKMVLSPAWTTDWLSEEGKVKLKAYGIAPPVKSSTNKNLLFGEEKAIQCPLCNSFHTELISQFGSTACKALHRCLDCKEPFDYFKCH